MYLLHHVRYLFEVLGDLLVCNRIVTQITADILVVCRHVDQSVSGEVEEYRLLFTALLAFQGFADGGGDGMTTLRSRDDTLCA